MTPTDVTPAVRPAKAGAPRKFASNYLSTCHKEFIAWLYEQAAKGSYHLLVVLMGLLSEYAHWN